MLLLSIILLLGIFSGTYYIHGVLLSPVLLISIISFPFVLFQRNKFQLYISLLPLKSILLSAFVFLFFCILSMLVNNVDSNTVTIVFRYFLKTIFLPFFCFFLVYLIVDKCQDDSLIFKSVVMLLFIQLFVTILQLTMPSFRKMFIGITNLQGSWLTMAEHGHFRATGIAGISIYDTSIAYSLIIIILALYSNYSGVKNNLICYIGIITATFLSFLTGRTGMMISLFSIFLLIMSSKNKYFYIMAIIISGIVMVFTLVALLGIDNFMFYLKFIMKPLYLIFDSANTSSASLSQLQNDYLFIPWNVNVAIGDGQWAQPGVSLLTGYQYGTDSGIILSYILAGPVGIVFSVLLLTIFIYVINKYISIFSNFSVRWVVVTGVSFILLFSLFKGPIYFSDRILPVILLMSILYAKIKNNKTRCHCCSL